MTEQPFVANSAGRHFGADAGVTRTSAPRIAALDLARGLAVLGMVAAHVGNDGQRTGPEGAWPWLVVSHGFPSALFAVLAGVSMTFMLTARGTIPVEQVGRERLRSTRIRIATRAALLIPLGYVLAALDTPVVVILANLGVMFVLALPLLRAPMWVLGTVGGIAIAAGGWASRELLETLPDIPIVDLLWAEHYPAIAWMGYICAGLIVGRLRMSSFRMVWALLAVAVASVVIAFRLVRLGASQGWDVDGPWLTTEPHSYSPIEMLANTGVALGVIAVCLMLVYPGHGAVGRILRGALWPIMSVGTMALTAYVAHIIVIAIVGTEMVWEPTNEGLMALWLGLLVGCSLWRWQLGAGPLERGLTKASTAAATRWT
ncbi:heparan-alpha-glucosaminide N-acetyltransferase domain-containing protein [Demequina flava]|uniref:heparan-alpha-glucosaminide N-acetyltransferase domain-containing protein n=1 Tax=Demequina flava TaxID=1095025 RepID=UPI000ABFC053|nr:heparan-alpha-glucosaminide N-acetyltransferase domain-containing protein [Demequina flava]